MSTLVLGEIDEVTKKKVVTSSQERKLIQDETLDEI